MSKALSSLAKTNKDSLLKVHKWCTGFYHAIGVAQNLIDKAKEAGETLTKAEVKVLVKKAMGFDPGNFNDLSKAKQALAIAFQNEFHALPEVNKRALFAKGVRGGAAKALGWSADRVPYLGTLLAVGGFGLFGGASKAAAGEGQYVKGVEGTPGVALNVGALLLREEVAADEIEWVAKSAIEAASKTGVLAAPPHELRQKSARRGVNLHDEESGLMNPVNSLPLKGKNEVPQHSSERWEGPLSVFNP